MERTGIHFGRDANFLSDGRLGASRNGTGHILKRSVSWPHLQKSL